MSNGKQKSLKVFISSTYIDLKEYRQFAIEAIERYGCVPLAMERFGSQPEEPTKVAKRYVKECDILVGIYAHRYGFIPKKEKKSITQQEYELAKKLGKPVLCFIVAENYPWNPMLCEMDKHKKLEDFLELIKKEQTVSFFTTQTDFAIKVATSLGMQIKKMEGIAEEITELERGVKLIPIAPTPYFAHSYALPPNFTGREAEQAMLRNWLYNAKEPMLVLEAIGGMGKTALSWVWLHEEVLQRHAELDGAFWWSFYEDPFETFIEHLFHYVTSREVKLKRGALESGAMATLNSVLHNNRFLLILDGFERALRGYASMGAMYIQEKGFSGAKAGEADWDGRQRECVHPHAAKFLKTLASAKTKTLMTTRLFPTALEEISCVQHELLSGLSRIDAVRFLRSEGIVGTRAQMERAGEIYDFHPLMLKQLSSAIKRKRKKDIADAFELNLIDEKEPQKILNKSFELLREEEKNVAMSISVFRSSFDFDAAKTLFPKMDEDALWDILSGLQQLGFIFYDEREKSFDFHPIMRSFLYDSLTSKDKVHKRAAEYFQKMPPVEKVVKLEDLNPVIELYHHLVGASKFDEARDLFRDRLAYLIYYQLSAYNLMIELLIELFVDGEDKPPRLKSGSDQAWTLVALANSYSLSGEPAKAMLLFLRSIFPGDEERDKEGVAISLENAADDQLKIGKVLAAGVHLGKDVALSQEIKDEFAEAVSHCELGRVLAYQDRAEAKDKLANTFRLLEKQGVVQSLSVVSACRSFWALLQGRLATASGKQKACKLSLEALEEAYRALEFTEEDAKTDVPTPIDFVWAYWLLGETLIQCVGLNAGIDKGLEIRFYDEYFQGQKEKFVVKAGNELKVAEWCLNEALRRCRSINLVELEADILLACARLEWVKTPAMARDADKLKQIEGMLKEAHQIAERSEYRLQLADIHLFCGEILIETGQARLHGLSAKEHLEKAKEYAKDVSTFDDLYKSKDPHFYDGIEGYEMLKRGMTEKERIENGYFVAYQIAEALEKKLN